MTKIIKHQSKWKQRGWVVASLVSVLLQLVVHRDNPYFFILFLFLGIIAVYIVLFTNTLKGDFIVLDKTTITVKEDGQEYCYSMAEIDQISSSNNHLRIKSGPANGILVNLKGYSQKDILLIEAFFDLPERMPPEALA